MLRRNFLRFSALTAVSVVVVPQLSAVDFRETKPEAWTAHTVEDAIKEMYGDISPIEKGITISAPSLSTNGGRVPIGIQSNLSAKSLAFFQDANPESAVIAYTLHKNSVIDYTLQIKMKGPGTVTAILEGTDGKFYIARKTMKVEATGCDQ